MNSKRLVFEFFFKFMNYKMPTNVINEGIV